MKVDYARWLDEYMPARHGINAGDGQGGCHRLADGIRGLRVAGLRQLERYAHSVGMLEEQLRYNGSAIPSADRPRPLRLGCLYTP